jgi:hypothetical protein
MTTKEQATKQGTPKTTGSAMEARPADVPPEDPAALKADIEQTREELGSAVEALVAKTDVKTRIREKTGTAKARAQETAGTVTVWTRDKTTSGALAARRGVQQLAAKSPQVRQRAADAGRAVRQNPKPAVLATAAAVAAVALLVLRRRRRNR